MLKVFKRGVAFDLGESNGMGSFDGDNVPKLLPKVAVSVT